MCESLLYTIIMQVSTWFANCRRRLKKANQEEEERNNNYGSSNGYSGNSYSEESTSPQRRSRSPRSHSPCSRKHDSDEKLNYDCVTPTAKGDNSTVGCKCESISTHFYSYNTCTYTHAQYTEHCKFTMDTILPLFNQILRKITTQMCTHHQNTETLTILQPPSLQRTTHKLY